MAANARDGFYKRPRSKFYWARDPVSKLRVSTGSTSIEGARAWRAKRERLAADPVNAAAEAAELGEWVVRWLELKQQTKSAATLEVGRQKLGHLIRLLGAAMRLAKILPPVIDRYVAQRRLEQVSDHTISKEIAHLLAVLKLAKRAGCYAGALDTLRPPDLHAGYQPRKRALTRDELAALLSQLTPNRGAFVAVCVALGCRLSEAFRLAPTDIEADKVLLRGKKTRGALRELPILSIYRPLLEQAIPWLPLEPWGKLHRDLAAACRRAGIAKCSPNDLRRTHSTLLSEAGVDRDVIRRLLGHTSTAMVDRVYGQPKPEALGSLAEAKLDQADALKTVQLRHTSQGPIPKTALAPVAQRIEQRFPNPNRADRENALPADSLEQNSTRQQLSACGNRLDSAGAGTSTSQSVDAAWALIALSEQNDLDSVGMPWGLRRAG